MLIYILFYGLKYLNNIFVFSYSFTDIEGDTSGTDDTLTKRAMAIVGSETVTQTANLMISTTMSGLSKLGQSVRAITTGNVQENIEQNTASTSSIKSVDTEEEFEVLNKEDFEK